MAIIELLPDYARVIEDGLYRAIDIYLKAHPSLTESECKRLCNLIDCQKLSQKASNHAAQNDGLPVQMVWKRSSKLHCLSQRQLCLIEKGEPGKLKLEISRMRVRLSELEMEQSFMKRGMREGRSGKHGKAFFSSISQIFGPAAGKQHKSARKSMGVEGKSH
ncbi:uncharacterized protein A4U43_C02F17540 [Asparagus officinalis]|uniref:NPH3 domain-containing protein n=1 Tax=Asparagus officinalis TaxID=4686 RepID=A0A5P1FJP5_ASPOF|nr:uncharacterized protein A4U43_C02F17540 [Asparagus officinalis]